MLLSKEDQLHKFLLKKIKREVASGKAVLHLSSKQQQIDELLSADNHYTKVDSLDELAALGIANPGSRKLFSYVIADLDNPELDNFDEFLDRVAPMIVRPGLLIVIATNLCSFKNQLAIWFGNELENFERPSRAVPPGFLRNKLLRKGFFVKNRFWQYDNKLLIMAETPVVS